jgi:hypothetical protein
MSHTNPSTQYFNTPGNDLQRELDRHVKPYTIDFNCPVCGLKRGHPNNHTKCSKILQTRYNAIKSNL